MSTLLVKPEFKPQPRLLTSADVAALPEELPTGPVDYELDNGRLVVIAPTGDTHGAVQSNLAAQLKIQGELRGLGKSRTETGVILWRNPDRLVGPDNIFVSSSSLPLKKSPEGYLETIPDLVAKVRSPNDALGDLQAKVKDYLKAGVRLVWLIDPTNRTVTAYRAGGQTYVVSGNDDLVADEIIPGFRLPLADLFRE